MTSDGAQTLAPRAGDGSRNPAALPPVYSLRYPLRSRQLHWSQFFGLGTRKTNRNRNVTMPVSVGKTPGVSGRGRQARLQFEMTLRIEGNAASKWGDGLGRRPNNPFGARQVDWS